MKGCLMGDHKKMAAKQLVSSQKIKHLSTLLHIQFTATCGVMLFPCVM